MGAKTVAGLIIIGGLVAGGVLYKQQIQDLLMPPAPKASSTEAQAKPAAPARVVPVTIGKAEAKQVPLRVDSIGSVQAMSTVTLKTRVESIVAEVLVNDGAIVNAGDVLFRLDARSIDAQIKQAEAGVQRDAVMLEQARRTVKRQEDLQARDIGARSTLEDSRSAAGAAEATLASDQAQLENLKVQRSYYTIAAPISGRIGSIALKVGNIAKTGDSTTPLGVINQFKPIYVAFPVPQRAMIDLREAVRQGTAEVSVQPQGLDRSVKGRIGFVDNSFDPTNGTISVRAVFDNEDDLLWPGALCNVRVTLRMEQGVTVAREAVQSSQNGNFVYIVEDGVARVRPVTVARVVDREAVIASGLKGGETVVTDGQLQLTDGARVQARTASSALETKKDAS